MGAQILDITQRYHPDFIITHLFGRSPSVVIKGLKGAGYPLSKVLGLVWASAEADILAAGGWGVAEGYNTLQFAGAGDDYPVRQQIKAMYKKDGKEPPKEMDNTVIYNRGLLQAAVQVQALTNALKISGGQKPTGPTGQGRHGTDPRLHPGRSCAAAADHPDRPRGRRLGPGLPGP